MQRCLLRLFPPGWRDRYGDAFLEDFRADPRRITKWGDALRTATGLRWVGLGERDDTLAVLLVSALALTLGCDLALGVGLDERIDVALFEHWWAAPFAAPLALGAVLAAASVVTMLRDGWRRRPTLAATGGIVAGAAAGSALLAAASFDLAGPGAGAGLVVATASARALFRAPVGRADALLAAGVAMILILGWRTASGPVGPLVLLVLTGPLVATRAPPRPHGVP